MSLRYKNGFLVQHLYDIPYGMAHAINTCAYNGLSARNTNPLSLSLDPKGRKLSEEAQWLRITEQKYVMLEFISNPSILLRYIRICQKFNIPIRLLFVESDYSGEVWVGPDIPKKFLGYEYNTIPIDDQIINDLCWYDQLSSFLERVNSCGLFASLNDVVLFKNAYDQAFEQGEIGDGDMETHIFCLFSVKSEDALRCLMNDANSD
jgi:hypothetical protein